MWEDLHGERAAKTTEISHLNGAIVELGSKVGVATPVNAAIVAAVKSIETGHVPAMHFHEEWRMQTLANTIN